MFPANKSTLLKEATDILLDSKGTVVLKQKPKSNNWWLFIDGTLVQEMRSARAMSFLDGWKACSAFNVDKKPLALLLAEDPNLRK